MKGSSFVAQGQHYIMIFTCTTQKYANSIKVSNVWQVEYAIEKVYGGLL